VSGRPSRTFICLSACTGGVTVMLTLVTFSPHTSSGELTDPEGLEF
jgi:hypothetical protein